MSSTPIANSAAKTLGRTATWRDYVELTKPEITFLVTLSAIGGFLLGSPEAFQAWTFIATIVGVVLCAAGAGTLNHYLERDSDAKMKRTSDRPIPAGRVKPIQARNFGAGLVVAGIGLLCPTANPLTAILAALTVVLYLFVYTPLKKTTSLNTLIGTLPGAIPVLGGYAAATGTLGLSGGVLFAILVAWQMPHFLSLAWMYRKDYARGKYAMLPVCEPSGDSTARQIIGFTALLLGVSVLLPLTAEPIGWIYTAGAVLLGGWFLFHSLQFYGERTGLRARNVLKASVYYIPALMVLIFVDWLV